MSEPSSLIGRWRCVWRLSWLAFALTTPVLCLAQEAGAPPGLGSPAAELPGAQPPGSAPMMSGLMNALELLPEGTQFAHYGASAGVGATDNVNLSATHPKSQALAAASLFFNLLRKGSRLEAIAIGNFSDIEYLEHAYGNQVLGRFDGFANLTLWSHHLTWLVREDYGDQQINPLQSMTPSNLQRVNIFSTGPNLRLQPTLSSFVDLHALYSRTNYQDSPFSGQGETGSVTLGHSLSEESSISLVGMVQQLSFDNKAINSDYQRREYYGQYSLRGARTVINLQGGDGQTNDTGTWKSSPLVRFSLMRGVSPFSTVMLQGGREYSDISGGFANLTSGPSGGIPIGPAAQTTANALHTYGAAGWDFHRLRTTIDLTGRWSRNEYDRQSTYDVTQSSMGLTLGRQLTERMSAYLTGTANRSQYNNQAFSDIFATVGGSLVYRPGEWVVIYGRYDHQFRRPSGEAARGLGYDENRVFIMIGYYPPSRGTGVPGGGGMGGGGGFGAMP